MSSLKNKVVAKTKKKKKLKKKKKKKRLLCSETTRFVDGEKTACASFECDFFLKKWIMDRALFL